MSESLDEFSMNIKFLYQKALEDEKNLDKNQALENYLIVDNLISSLSREKKNQINKSIEIEKLYKRIGEIYQETYNELSKNNSKMSNLSYLDKLSLSFEYYLKAYDVSKYNYLDDLITYIRSFGSNYLIKIKYLVLLLKYITERKSNSDKNIIINELLLTMNNLEGWDNVFDTKQNDKPDEILDSIIFKSDTNLSYDMIEYILYNDNEHYDKREKINCGKQLDKLINKISITNQSDIIDNLKLDKIISEVGSILDLNISHVKNDFNIGFYSGIVTTSNGLFWILIIENEIILKKKLVLTNPIKNAEYIIYKNKIWIIGNSIFDDQVLIGYYDTRTYFPHDNFINNKMENFNEIIINNNIEIKYENIKIKSHVKLFNHQDKIFILCQLKSLILFTIDLKNEIFYLQKYLESDVQVPTTYNNILSNIQINKSDSKYYFVLNESIGERIFHRVVRLSNTLDSLEVSELFIIDDNNIKTQIITNFDFVEYDLDQIKIIFNDKINFKTGIINIKNLKFNNKFENTIKKNNVITKILDFYNREISTYLESELGCGIKKLIYRESDKILETIYDKDLDMEDLNKLKKSGIDLDEYMEMLECVGDSNDELLKKRIIDRVQKLKPKYIDNKKNIKINKKIYNVKSNEFELINHEQFNNLIMYEGLRELEISIGLIKDLNEINIKSGIFFYNTSHDCFIQKELYGFYEKIYIYNKISKSTIDTNKFIELKNLDKENFEKITKEFDIFFIQDIDTNYVVEKDLIDSILGEKIIISGSNEYLDKNYKHKYIVPKIKKIIYIPDKLNTQFYSSFKYYLEDTKIQNYQVLNYDNLIHYTMIIKNGGDILEEVLLENKKYFDRWTILDTGSTDNTVETIKRVLSDKKGELYEEPFINFRESRNRCLDLAGSKCKYVIMLDDTYVIKNDLRGFLNTVRGDQFADSFSLMIQSKDLEYYSNRILKSDLNLRYMFKIHEIITHIANKNVVVPKECGYILDKSNNYMEDRTTNRKQKDLEWLFESVEEEPNQPRHLYYLGQTYNNIGNFEKAAEYFEKRLRHKRNGFIQEKIDACFELARLYNFKLNKPWDETEKLYLESYNMDTTRPDSPYYLGLHYFLEKNNIEAYKYFKLVYKIGFPIHAQYSLKPTISYVYGPYYLANLCYEFRDYTLGKEVCEFFLFHNKQNITCKIIDHQITNLIEIIESWWAIYITMINYMNILETKLLTYTKEKPIICYVADGGYNKWNGSDILNKGVGGSETYIIEMSRYIKKHSDYRVVVFCKCAGIEETFEGVEYLDLSKYGRFVIENEVDLCIISRFSQYVPVAYNSRVKNVYMVLHDLGPIGTVIPINSKLKKIFTLTEWHKDYFSQNFPTLSKYAEPFYYGIDFDKFSNNENIVKQPGSFIYSSFANRGLVILLEMWDRIKKIIPYAQLHIYCDIYHTWVVQNYPEDSKRIQEIIESRTKVGDTSIVYHGWVNKRELANQWLRSEFWLYPCIFAETFCLTAMEAALTKTLVITNDLAALQNTVGDRGIVVPGDARSEQWCTKVLEELETLSLEKKNKYLEKNYSWAITHSWEQRGIKFKNEFIDPII